MKSCSVTKRGGRNLEMDMGFEFDQALGSTCACEYLTFAGCCRQTINHRLNISTLLSSLLEKTRSLNYYWHLMPGVWSAWSVILPENRTKRRGLPHWTLLGLKLFKTVLSYRQWWKGKGIVENPMFTVCRYQPPNSPVIAARELCLWVYGAHRYRLQKARYQSKAFCNVSMYGFASSWSARICCRNCWRLESACFDSVSASMPGCESQRIVVLISAKLGLHIPRGLKMILLYREWEWRV